jgi:hypothetical protein
VVVVPVEALVLLVAGARVGGPRLAVQGRQGAEDDVEIAPVRQRLVPVVAVPPVVSNRERLGQILEEIRKK